MTVPLLLTAAMAAAAAALAIGGSGATVARRRLPSRPRTARSWLPRRRALRGDAVGVLAALAVVLVFGIDLLVVAATSALVVGAALRLVDSRHRRQQAQARRRQVVEVCDALGAELRAGQPNVRALRRVADEQPLVEQVARAAALGGDVPVALHAVADRPGADGLRMIAAAWRVADCSGAGLALVLDRIAAALRAEQAASVEVAASLGPPRATAQMLAVLPVFGLLLGVGLGGDPVGFLLQTWAGNLCLAAGSALAAAGLWWVERLASAVERT
ncbi:MAG TPA: type II secretion system F family protein [Nocardioidaceae bacterium]|nr:type II secretion system F family protein [Nocardioidaceae bacterium]